MPVKIFYNCLRADDAPLCKTKANGAATKIDEKLPAIIHTPIVKANECKAPDQRINIKKTTIKVEKLVANDLLIVCHKLVSIVFPSINALGAFPL